ncbi:MAG TPA: mechanosensitive ion channel family protein [Burkholderiales bacterium]|nr:mechanosensitive ion channel family protein [Burkholderiales bacterium]
MAWALQALAGRLIRVFRGYMASRTSAADELRRIDTVGNAFRYFASVVVVLVAGMLILNELGISIAPILATAGVAGIAIAFGAQSLIKDYFTGFFLLIEDQIRQGDVVEISGKSGEVEEVTLRYVRLRDNDGFVHFVPNGEIKLVTNRTRGFGQAVMDAVIKSSQSVEDAFQAMRDVGREMRQDAAFAPQILGDVQIAGIERWEHFGVFLRCRMKVLPEEQWRVRAEFMRRLKIAFEQRGIQSP